MNSLLTIEKKICCDKLHNLVFDKIIYESLLIDQSSFHKKIEEFKRIDFQSEKAVLTSDYFDGKLMIISLKPQITNKYKIDEDFYEGIQMKTKIKINFE